MPFVRCKFYTESGGPVRGGCRRKGAGCAFIHPGDPDWINAPLPTLKAREKGGDSGGFKSWGGKRSATAPSAWDAGGNTSTSAAVTGGGWGAGSGWGTGSGWDAGSTSTPSQVPEPTQSNNTSTTKSRDPSTLGNDWDLSAIGNPHTGGGGWGGTDKDTGSGWGTANGGWGTSSWGDAKDTDKAAGSGWGATQNNGQGASWGSDKDADRDAEPAWGSTQSGGWGASWGNNKDADRDAEPAWGSTQSGGWGAGWGNSKDTTNSWGAPDPITVDKSAEKETDGNRGNGKSVPAPPRIRIPDNENKKTKTSGKNNEPLGYNKWGQSRASNLATTSTPVTTSTPIVAITPTDSLSLKRKHDAAFDNKLDVFKEYIKAWERGVRTRFLLAEAEAKRDRWFRTQKSACYARIGEAGRKRLDGQRAECDKEVDLQREKLSCAITSLVGFHDTNSSNLDLGQRYNVGEEAKKFSAESRAYVDEVRALLVAHVLRDKNDVELRNTHGHPPGVDVTSLDSLRSQVRDLEERFDQAQTELTLRHQRDIRSEIDELLAAKIAALRVARQDEIDRIALQPRAEIVIPPSVLESIEGTVKQVRELDEKVPQTVEDIRVLLLRVDATTKRVSELEEELSVNKETYRKVVREMAAEKEGTERRIDEGLEKIRRQFEQLVASQALSPAAQPAVSPTVYSSRDRLMESLQPAFKALLDNFYEHEVRPTIESLQRAVVEASDRHQEEAIKVLWGKVQPAMNMVAGVSRWLDSQELRLTAPVDGDVAI